MDQIYRDRTGEAERNRAREALPLRPAGEIHPGPVRETALQQIERRFARLENPDLIMVVFPHLAHGKYPVPGYVTAFPMHESVEYLLPGEDDGPPRPETPAVPSAPGGSETTARAPGRE
jgi:conjugative transfer region lipoprotein (TIGR03751 family)